MTHSNSNRVRLSGTLVEGKRGYLLQCEDENVWRLNLIEVDIPDGATDVIVEGLQSRVDVVDVDWLGLVNLIGFEMFPQYSK